MSKENEYKNGEICPSRKTLSREEIEDLKERLALQDNLSARNKYF